MTQIKNDSTDADIAALETHQESITAPHRAAFGGPVVLAYQPGQVVWMYDHYNTAVVVGPGMRRGNWTVSTCDADGCESTYEYKPEWLRPAAEARVFTWTAAAPAE